MDFILANELYWHHYWVMVMYTVWLNKILLFSSLNIDDITTTLWPLLVALPLFHFAYSLWMKKWQCSGFGVDETPSLFHLLNNPKQYLTLDYGWRFEYLVSSNIKGWCLHYAVIWSLPIFMDITMGLVSRTRLDYKFR